MTESIAEKRSIKDRLEQALVQHRAGQLRNAEALYQDILNEAPEHPDALHLLGLIRGEQGQEYVGIKLIERLGAEVIGCAFVIDLPELGGRRKLEAMGMRVHALCSFDGH